MQRQLMQRRWVTALAVLSITFLAGPGWSNELAANAGYSEKGADTCLMCHQNATVTGIFQNVHGNPAHPQSPFGASQLQCESCHGPGGTHAGRVARGQVRPSVIRFGSQTDGTSIETQNQMCTQCHQADLSSNRHGPHQDLACADCHSTHSPTDAVLRPTLQSEACVTCHHTQRAALLKPFRHMTGEGFTCSECHDVHNAKGPAELKRQTLNQTCYQCHAEKRGPFLWEHAPVAEDCSLCHDAHGSNHPSMLTRRAPFLCQSCHAQAGHPSIANTADGLEGVRSQFLLGNNCMNCHSLVHGSNHPSGSRLMR